MQTGWIKKASAAKGISGRKLSTQIGLDSGALSRTLSGRRKMQLAEAMIIAEMLEIDFYQFLFNCGFSQYQSDDYLALNAENARLKEMVRNLSQMI